MSAGPDRAFEMRQILTEVARRKYDGKETKIRDAVNNIKKSYKEDKIEDTWNNFMERKDDYNALIIHESEPKQTKNDVLISLVGK